MLELPKAPGRTCLWGPHALLSVPLGMKKHYKLLLPLNNKEQRTWRGTTKNNTSLEPMHRQKQAASIVIPNWEGFTHDGLMHRILEALDAIFVFLLQRAALYMKCSRHRSRL